MSTMNQPPDISTKKIEKVIRSALIKSGNSVIKEITAELKRRKWKPENIPKWKRIRTELFKGDLVAVLEIVEGSPFEWVDKGTDGPYTIAAKNAPFLKFKVPPIDQQDSGWRSVLQVTHKGIKAQNISGPILEKESEVLSKNIDKSLAKL